MCFLIEKFYNSTHSDEQKKSIQAITLNYGKLRFVCNNECGIHDENSHL